MFGSAPRRRLHFDMRGRGALAPGMDPIPGEPRVALFPRVAGGNRGDPGPAIRDGGAPWGRVRAEDGSPFGRAPLRLRAPRF